MRSNASIVGQNGNLWPFRGPYCYDVPNRLIAAAQQTLTCTKYKQCTYYSIVDSVQIIYGYPTLAMEFSLIMRAQAARARAKYELTLKFIYFYGNYINLYKHFLFVKRLNVLRSRVCDHIYTIAFRRPQILGVIG